MKLIKTLICFLIAGTIISCSSNKKVVKTTTTTTTTTTQIPKRASDRDTAGFANRPHPGVVNIAHTYKCCYGDFTSKDPISCPTHNIDLITVGSYYCNKCDGVVSTKPGTCPIHKSSLIKMQ